MASENEKYETLADIEADLRDRADCAERHGDRETHNDGVAMFLRSIADRIEAIDSADAWRSLYTPGNAAAMREALESARNWCLNRLGNASYQVTIEGLLSVVDAALSAPTRNCDLFGGDPKMLNTAWFDWTASPSGHDAIGVAKMTFAGWLLAPAAELKKEGKGDGAR